MSRKNKAARAFFHQNPDATPKDAWDAAWKNEQGRFASQKHEDQQATIATQAATIEALRGDSQYSITPLIDFGQVAIGDGLIFQTGDEFIVITAKAVLNKGLASEEVIYRNKKNHYFITSMVLSGESHAKNILVVKNPAPPADTGEGE